MGDKQKRSIVPPSYKKIKQRTDRVLVKEREREYKVQWIFREYGREV